MNTRLATRLAAFASATFFTVVILSGIDALASSEAGGAVVAQAAPAAVAAQG